MTKIPLPFDKKFYGSTTVGEKGQVVVPQEARQAMNLKKGEKLLVFGAGNEAVAFVKVSAFEKFASHVSHNLTAVQNIIKRSKK